MKLKQIDFILDAFFHLRQIFYSNLNLNEIWKKTRDKRGHPCALIALGTGFKYHQLYQRYHTRYESGYRIWAYYIVSQM